MLQITENNGRSPTIAHTHTLFVQIEGSGQGMGQSNFHDFTDQCDQGPTHVVAIAFYVCERNRQRQLPTQ